MIQKTYKGWKIRSDYLNNREKLLKQKGAARILLCYRRTKFRRYLKALILTYGNFMGEKMWGKFLTWPTTPKYSSTAADAFNLLVKRLKAIYAKYRAVKMIKTLNTEQQEEMRQKISAYDIFHGKKPWEFSRRFMADYLEMDSNPLKEKYLVGMQRLFTAYGETTVLFSDYAIKVNRHGKGQRRAIVVTDKTIYKQDPDNYKVKKGELPISEITDINVHSGKDTFVVVRGKAPWRDLVVDLGASGPEKVSEFVTVICDQYKIINHNNTIPVNFVTNVKYNNARDPKNAGIESTVTWQQLSAPDPKMTTVSAFRQGKNHVHSIVYK